MSSQPASEFIETGLRVIIGGDATAARPDKEMVWQSIGDDDHEISLLQDYYESNENSHQQSYWKYRGQAALAVSSAGAAVRFKIGLSTDFNDRNLYRQTISVGGASNSANWNWGTNGAAVYTSLDPWYAVAAYQDGGGTVRVVSANATGIYLDGNLKLSRTGVIKIKAVHGSPGSIWYAVIGGTDHEHSYMDWYFVENINAASPVSTADKFNNMWAHEDITSILWNSIEYRVRACPYGMNPKNPKKSDGIFVEAVPWANNMQQSSRALGEIVRITAPSGRAGIRVVKDAFFFRYSFDRFIYFFTEHNTDEDFISLTNVESQPFYMMGEPTGYMTEPIPTGFSIWGLAGAFEQSGYLYLAGNSRVIRAVAMTELDNVDISNYALAAEFNLLTDNQKSTGSIVLANPDNEVGNLIGYNPNQHTTDVVTGTAGLDVQVQLGQKNPEDADYTWGEPNIWSLAKINRINTDDKEHLILELEDIWGRLQSEYYTSFYYPGQIMSHDWVDDGDNSIKNYFVAQSAKRLTKTDGPNEQFPKMMVQPRRRRVLDTRWRLLDGDATIKFDKQDGEAIKCGLIFRYISPGNYWEARYDDQLGRMSVYKYVNRKLKHTIIQDAGVAVDLNPVRIRVIFRGNWIRVYLNGDLVVDQDVPIENFPPWRAGFVGAWENIGAPPQHPAGMVLLGTETITSGPGTSALTIPVGATWIVLAMSRGGAATASVGTVPLTVALYPGIWYGDISERLNNNLVWSAPGGGENRPRAIFYIQARQLEPFATGSTNTSTNAFIDETRNSVIPGSNVFAVCEGGGQAADVLYNVIETLVHSLNESGNVTAIAKSGPGAANTNVRLRAQTGSIIGGASIRWAFFREGNPD